METLWESVLRESQGHCFCVRIRIYVTFPSFSNILQSKLFDPFTCLFILVSSFLVFMLGDWGQKGNYWRLLGLFMEASGESELGLNASMQEKHPKFSQNWFCEHVVVAATGQRGNSSSHWQHWHRRLAHLLGTIITMDLETGSNSTGAISPLI